MVFCNELDSELELRANIVTILILIDGFLQSGGKIMEIRISRVTILILIDGFLQYKNEQTRSKCSRSQSLF